MRFAGANELLCYNEEWNFIAWSLSTNCPSTVFLFCRFRRAFRDNETCHCCCARSLAAGSQLE